MLYKLDNFRLEELVCKHVFEKFGATAWQFFDDKALMTIDTIRKKLNKRITVNTWHNGGAFTQRGLRCTRCQLIVDAVNDNRCYVTPHLQGQAFDFDVEGLIASEVRVWLMKYSNLLPFPIRLENNVSWVHLDIRDAGKEKVYIFEP